MKTRKQIEQKITDLRLSLADMNCPCGCQDQTRWIVEGEIAILEWVIEDVDEERQR